MDITPEMVNAWTVLQDYAAKLPRYVNLSTGEQAAVDAINTLDNSNFMVPIEEYANELETAAQFAASAVAEWGDTTREDMTRHQNEAL